MNLDPDKNEAIIIMMLLVMGARVMIMMRVQVMIMTS